MKIDLGEMQQRDATEVPVNRGSEEKRRSGFGLDKVALTVVILYLVIPLVATLIFGLANGSNIDFSTYARTFSDPDFSTTLLISLELALATTLLAVLLVTPTAYWVQMRLPQVRPL